jgi:hypothetical protein
MCYAIIIPTRRMLPAVPDELGAEPVDVLVVGLSLQLQCFLDCAGHKLTLLR